MNSTEIREKINSVMGQLDNLSIDLINDYNQLFKDDFEKALKAKFEYEKKKRKIENDKKLVRYRYPFVIHLAGANLPIDHIFENGKKYTEEEIREKMLQHQYYDFAGKVTFTYLEKENVLLPIFQQHKKG